MKALSVNALIFIAASVICSQGASARQTPPCMVTEAQSASCTIRYTDKDGLDSRREFSIGRMKFEQNLGSTSSCLDVYPKDGIFDADLSGSFQGDEDLHSSGFAGEVVEDLIAGTFDLREIHYNKNLAVNAWIVTDFPEIRVSFKTDSQQFIRFKESGFEVQATMNCKGIDCVGTGCSGSR